MLDLPFLGVRQNEETKAADRRAKAEAVFRGLQKERRRTKTTKT
jgi:hypothetical protein